MAKKSSWLTVLKRFFVSDTESRPEKGKRKRWMFGLFMDHPPPREQQISGTTGTEDKRSHGVVNVEVSSSEANAASVPSTVPRCVACPPDAIRSVNQHKEETTELSAHNLNVNVSQCCYEYDWEIQNLAAIKIQTAFRGYLAKKALRALKGIVKLQAIIRGQAVRRQAIVTLKCLQSIVSIQSEVRAKGCNMEKKTLDVKENQFQDPTEKDIRIDLNSQRGWDNRILSKEEANAKSLSKREASFKRDRIKEYWLTHRKSTESEQGKVNARRYWLEQWVDSQLAKREDLRTLDIFSTSARMREEFEQREYKLRNLQKHQQKEGLVSATHVPRRSFHHKRQHSTGDDSPLVACPTVPTYMAATKSVEAKARSMSSPRLRPINLDVYSEINSPYRYKLSPISSINSDATVNSMIGGRPSFTQRSPGLKSVAGPARSKQKSKGY
nr:protein IQ-DOMAIN 14-like [Ipomoea batatas]